MNKLFEELDPQATPMGEISVRRRLDPILGIDVYEVKLGDEHLMSNTFTAAEIALADLALAAVEGDFFTIVADGAAFGPSGLDRYDAILLDIDHTPTHVLHPSHAAFYTADGLRRLAARLQPGGVFALWSDAPDDDFLATARSVFDSCVAHEVRFPNHHTGGEGTDTVYVARTPS